MINNRERQGPTGSRIHILIPAMVMALVCGPYPALGGQSIAVFPLLDLTRDMNGVNYTLSNEIINRIEKTGLQVIDNDALMEFMVQYRIRSLGQLSTRQIGLIKKKLGADLVLTGTVAEMRSDPLQAAICVSLNLIRTSDAAVVWAGSDSLASSDLTSLLGLNDPDSLGALFTVFFDRLLATFPTQVPEVPVPEHRLSIGSLTLYPSHVKPGDRLTCKIKLFAPLDDSASPSSFSLYSAGKTISIDSTDYPYLKATWTAPDIEGAQSVRLEATWEDGRSQQRDVGTVFIDATPPAVVLHLGAREREGQLYFNKKLLIIPELTNPEPISRWSISVFDEDGEIIVRQKASEHLPRRLIWAGQTSLGDQAKDGLYRIVFKVWDRAGWTAESEASILLKRRPPELEMEVKRQPETFQVTLADKQDTALEFWWAKFYASDGHLITLAEGDTLPAEISLPIPTDQPETGAVECMLLAQDVYGNQIRKTVKDITRLASNEDQEDTLHETEWLEEF